VPFWTRKPKTRSELVAAADGARAKGRLKAAVAGYRKVLAEHGPGDPHVHGKLAPLLARLEDGDGARASFRCAAEGHLQSGFLDRALAVYVQASGTFPLEPDFHSEAARIHLVRGRRADAAIVLATGGRALGRARRGEAIEMLRGALVIHPGQLEATLALAPLLREEGRRAEARQLLESVLPGLRGAALRRVRWAIFRVAPGFRTGWRWLRTLTESRWGAGPRIHGIAAPAPNAALPTSARPSRRRRAT
jgi:tetratricopeptide (TPR) repeat protein